MKHFSLIYGIVFFISLYTNAKSKSPISLISASNNSLIIKFESPSFKFIENETPKGISVIPLTQGASSILIEGVPDLPKYTCSYIIPDDLTP